MGDYISYKRAADELIAVINILKLRLVLKYGPDIKRRWQ